MLSVCGQRGGGVGGIHREQHVAGNWRGLGDAHRTKNGEWIIEDWLSAGRGSPLFRAGLDRLRGVSAEIEAARRPGCREVTAGCRQSMRRKEAT